MFLFLMSTLTLVGAAQATPPHIVEHPDYKNAQDQLRKHGKAAFISSMVDLQREIEKNNGGNIDAYTNSAGVIGMPSSIHQKVVYKIDGMLIYLNKIRASKNQIPFDRERLLSEIRRGGSMYRDQVNLVCSTPGTRALIDGGVDYVYSFHDDHMTFIEKIKFDKHLCSMNK